MLLQFANGRSQLPPPTIAVTAGGSNSTARSLYFALQGQNVAGYNLLSSIVGPVTIGINQQVTITIPSTAHAPGELFSDYVISASTTNVAADFVQIARVPAQDSGGADISLPASIALSTDEQFNLSAIVSAPANLPTASLISGMRRGVASLAYVFEYDSLNTQTSNTTTTLSAAPAPGNWLRVGGFSTIVDSTTGGGGCAQDVRAINEAAIEVPPYACNGQNGIGHRFWMVNDSTDAIPAGLRVMIGVTLGEVPSSGLFEGLLRVIFRGYVNTIDGTVRTVTATGETMRGLDQEVLFENKKTDLLLEDDLQPSEAYALDIYPNLRPEFLNNQVSNQSLIKVSVALALQAGAYVEGGSAWGDRIYPDYDRGLVIPQRVGAKCLKRSGMVNSRSFLGVASTLILGLQPNTDQFVYINSNGFVYLKTEAKLDTEAIRAKISTLSGISSPSPWSSAITVVAGAGLDITCTYPSNGTTGTIRANYPDPLLAGNAQGQFNNQVLTLYIRSTVASVATIKKFVGRLIIDGATQIFQVSDWSAGVTISTLPTSPSDDFSLFEAISAIAVSNGIGSIPAGTIEAAYAYELDGTQISAISHRSIDGALHTSTLTLADVEEASQYWAQAMGTIADLRAVPLSQIIAYQTRYVSEVNNPYRYSPASIADDDGYAVIKPTAKLTTEPGRWILDDSNAIYLLDAAPISTTPGEVGDIAIVTNTSSADVGNLYQKTAFNAWTLRGSVRGATGAAGTNGTNGTNGTDGATGSTGSPGATGSTGSPGATGATGSVSAAGGLIIEESAAIVTTSTQIALRNAGGILKLQDESSGLESAIALLDKPQTYSKAQRSGVVGLADATTIGVDADLSNLFTVTLAGNRSLGTPSNLQLGTNFEIQITQDATGTRTLAYSSAYKFAGGTAPTLSTAIGAIDILSCRSYDGATLKCDLGKGYS